MRLNNMVSWNMNIYVEQLKYQVLPNWTGISMGTDFMTYMNKATYCRKWNIHLSLCHSRIVYATLMVLDVIPQVYRAEAAQLHMTKDHHIFTLLPLPSITDEHESTAKSILSLTFIPTVTCSNLGFSVYIWKNTDINHPWWEYVSCCT